MFDFFNVPDASNFRLMVFLRGLQEGTTSFLTGMNAMQDMVLTVFLLLFLSLLTLCAFPQVHRTFSEGFARGMQATLGTASLLIALILFARYALGGDFSLLYYAIPTMAVFLVLVGCALSRKMVAHLLGGDLVQFFQGLVTAFLFVLAVFSVCNYFEYGKWRAGSFLNAYEHYHYYIGAKYGPEVGYTGMYDASLIADAELEGGTPRFNNSKGTLRNLDSGRHLPFRPILDRAEEIKAPFTEERWEEFKKDIAFFKSELSVGRWNHILTDKGYNATPVWTSVVDFLFTSRTDTADRRAMTRLAMLDLALIIVAAGFVLWAFGPRAVLLMIILLGTSYVMKYSHMKGAFLRTDFCMSLVVAICLVKKGHYTSAGMLSGYSFLSRIFPAVFFFGLGARFLWQIGPQVWPATRAFFQALGLRLHGAIPAVLVLLLLGGWVALFTVGPWPLVHLTQAEDGSIAWGGFNDTPVIGADWVNADGEPRFTQRFIPLFVFAVAPLLLMLGLFALAGLWALFKGRIDGRYVRYFSGLTATVAILVGFSVVYTGGFDYWNEYAAKIGKHNDDVSPWRVGFKYIFIGDLSTGAGVEFQKGPDTTRWEVVTAVYNEARKQEGANLLATGYTQTKFFLQELKPAIRSIIFRENKILWWTIMGVVLFISFFLVYGLKDHEAFAWSFVPVFFMVSPTYYYFIMLLIPLLFFSPYIDRPARAFGAILLLLAAMPGYWLYGELRYRQEFPTYYWHSIMYMGIVLYMALVAAGLSLTHLFRRGGPLRAELTPAPIGPGIPAAVPPPIPGHVPSGAPLVLPAREEVPAPEAAPSTPTDTDTHRQEEPITDSSATSFSPITDTDLQRWAERVAQYDVVLEPERDEAGWWAGAPSATVGPDGKIYLAVRMRHTDSPLGERGYELRILQSQDGKTFEHLHTLTREAADLKGFERPALIWDAALSKFVLYACTPLESGWVVIRFAPVDDLTQLNPTSHEVVLEAHYPDEHRGYVTGYKDPVLFHDGNRWNIFVIGRDDFERIHHFKAEGESWVRGIPAPVIPNRGWHDYYTRPASVLQLDRGYLLVYEGSHRNWHDRDYNIATGVAWSPDMRSFYDLTPDEPLFKSTTPGPSHTWRYSCWLRVGDAVHVYFEAARPNDSNELRCAIFFDPALRPPSH